MVHCIMTQVRRSDEHENVSGRLLPPFVQSEGIGEKKGTTAEIQ